MYEDTISDPSTRKPPFNLPKSIFKFQSSFLEYISINAEINAPLYIFEKGKKYKVIIFSHGLAANRQLYTIFTNNLAS